MMVKQKRTVLGKAMRRQRETPNINLTEALSRLLGFQIPLASGSSAGQFLHRICWDFMSQEETVPSLIRLGTIPPARQIVMFS